MDTRSSGRQSALTSIGDCHQPQHLRLRKKILDENQRQRATQTGVLKVATA